MNNILRSIFEGNFLILLIICFFFMSISFNISYFFTFGSSIDFFFYFPIGFFDIIKTGFVPFVYSMLFVVVFGKIFLDPVFKGKFPSVTTLLFLSILFFVTNLSCFLILDKNYGANYSIISELAFFGSSLIAFFGILYFFSRERSKEFLFVTFNISLIVVSFFVGWLNAKFDINSIAYENKSKILLINDKVITAKILRSIDKGILIMLNKDSNINFIAWDQIKEAKFKNVDKF